MLLRFTSGWAFAHGGLNIERFANGQVADVTDPECIAAALRERVAVEASTAAPAARKALGAPENKGAKQAPENKSAGQ